MNTLFSPYTSIDIELKSSFRYDVRLKASNPKVLEKMVSKTITAFMNAEGGTLFIGVDDQGNVLGLENDYKTLRIEHQNSDGFELELRQSVEKYMKNKIANEFFEVKFHNVGEKEICEVIIDSAPKPVFLYDEGGKQQECYVRVGNSSKPYNLDEFYQYSKRRSDLGETASVYADRIVFLFLGGFILAKAIEKTELHKRFALNILRAFGTNPKNIVAAFIIVTGFLSAWISNTATAMLMVPIASAVILQVDNPTQISYW